VNHTDAGFVILDPQLIVQWLNGDFVQLLEGTGKTGRCWDVLCGADDKCDDCPAHQAVATARVVHHEMRRTLNDVEHYLYATAVPIVGADGAVVETIVMVQNLTDLEVLRRSQAKLQSSEEIFRSLSNSSPIGIFRTNDAGDGLYVNPRFCEITGFNEEVLLHKGWKCAVHPDDVDHVIKWTAEGAASGQPYEGEFRLKRQDGNIAWVNVRIAPIIIELSSGGWVGTMVDVTDRRLGENKLKRAKEVAENASRAKSEFLANMSHEIRTPMNGVIGMTNMLARRGLDEPQSKLLGHVLSSAEGLMTIINDILDYSKIEAGRLEIERVPMDLREVISAVGDLLAASATSKGIAYDTAIGEDLPEMLMGDPVRVRQVITNLVSNAIKFTESGHVKIGVETIMLDESGALIRIAVEDTGIGIPQSKIDGIFDKFTQADTSTTRKYGGTGLGLAICTQLVELMCGSIEARSQEGVGTEFSVTLHLPLPDSSSELLSHFEEQEDTFRVEGSILVVEDNLINQELVMMILGDLGCEAVVAANGEDAVRLVEGSTYDLILMDCQMPVMDGYEATRRIRELGISTPIVALTAHAMSGDREKCHECGMQDYVAKPIRVQDIKMVLNKYLERTQPS